MNTQIDKIGISLNRTARLEAVNSMLSKPDGFKKMTSGSSTLIVEMLKQEGIYVRYEDVYRELKARYIFSLHNSSKERLPDEFEKAFLETYSLINQQIKEKILQ